MLLACSVGLASTPADAQSAWGDGRPPYESETQQSDEAPKRRTYAPVVYPKFMDGGERPDIKPAEPPIVYFGQQEEPGSIIVDTAARRLYFMLPGQKAYEYPISVGRDGFTWTGTERISRITAWPSWTPPPEMHKRQPGLPITVSGGMKNPQGARALYLGTTIYRIHGTNNDRTVGRANSSGCFRLTNEHVVHLASIAKVGTRVKVLQSYGGFVSESAPVASLFSGWNWGGDEPAPKPAAGLKPKPKKPLARKPATVAAGPAAVATAEPTAAASAPATPVPAAPMQPAAPKPAP
jgi:lipoprotein-anchoring transpeptidase ErfK/SrfK